MSSIRNTVSLGALKTGSDFRSWYKADFINLFAQKSNGSIFISRYIGIIASFFISPEERRSFIREVLPVDGSPMIAIFCLYPSEKELMRYI